MALWSLWSAPLLMSNDLRTIGADFKAVLQNQHIIAVDQDELGVMGRRVFNASGIEIWSKPMTPVANGTVHSFAIVYFNRRTLGSPVYVSSPRPAGQPADFTTAKRHCVRASREAGNSLFRAFPRSQQERDVRLDTVGRCGMCLLS